MRSKDCSMKWCLMRKIVYKSKGFRWNGGFLLGRIA